MDEKSSNEGDIILIIYHVFLVYGVTALSVSFSAQKLQMLHLYVYVDDAVAVENEQTIDERTGRQASVGNCTTSHKSL